MKKGAPTNAVTAPTGISDGAIIVLAKVSESVKKIAPIKKEYGITNLLSIPHIVRQTCGINNPIKPIMPLTETTEPIKMLAKK